MTSTLHAVFANYIKPLILSYKVFLLLPSQLENYWLPNDGLLETNHKRSIFPNSFILSHLLLSANHICFKVNQIILTFTFLALSYPLFKLNWNHLAISVPWFSLSTIICLLSFFETVIVLLPGRILRIL